jgi:hypothetical protein
MHARSLPGGCRASAHSDNWQPELPAESWPKAHDELAQGERPTMSDLLLTPANAVRVTEQLSRLRGAAMKLGQMISLDAGDMLPAELTQILARLRDAAHIMPPTQLEKVLATSWGPGWRRRFRRFDARPVAAAASIGQVHRAELPDGRVLAIKVNIPALPAASIPMSTMSQPCSKSRACCLRDSTLPPSSPRPSGNCTRKPTICAKRHR